MRFSVRIVGTLIGLALGAGVIVVLTSAGAGAPAAPAPAPTVETPSNHGAQNRVARARAILRAWDARRSAAWAAADPDALAELYLPGSVAGRRDVARLRRWAERGLRVKGLTMQVLEVDVVRWRRGRLTLRVLDRMLATSPSLPRDQPTVRLIELVRGPGGPGEWWRVGAVRSPQD